MIVLDIDVTKLDKARFRAGKSGQKYVDLVLFDKASEKSDGFVTQGISKEERESGVRMPIIGNWKQVGKGASKPTSPTPPAQPANQDDIPW